MTPSLRSAGSPSPLHDGTHEPDGLPPAIPFDPASAGAPEPVASIEPVTLDAFDLGEPGGLPAWMVEGTRMIRPICVGALMAIPTLGAATVGTVALFDRDAALHAVEASTTFLAGIPGDIILLIGALATGYSLSKTVERIKGARL